MASVLGVRPVGAPAGDSQVVAGTLLALKLARADEPLSVEALGREADVFQTLRSALGMPPCPRLHDVVLTERGQPVGLVMEWCPLDMERWWTDVHARPWAFSELCDALAEVCLRLREYQQTCAAAVGQRVAHADVKPRNLLRAQDARWLLTDFGASKARDMDVGDWSATRVILGTESYIAPEGLFNARKSHPEAMDTWSVGATLFALLRMHAHLRDGGRMPLNGTHSSQFRSHRTALVSDLHQRKPALFIDKPLDPSQFVSPERLPDKDRAAVADALKGAFAPQHEALVIDATLALLDRVMRIDPQQRFGDTAELAEALAALARLGRVDDGIEATRVSLATDAGLAALGPSLVGLADDEVSAPVDITGVRPLGPPPPGSEGVQLKAPAANDDPVRPARVPASPVSPVEPEVKKHVIVGGNARPAPVIIQRPPEDRESAPLSDVVREGNGKGLPPAPPAVPRDNRPDPLRVSRRIGPRFPAWLGVGIAVMIALQLVGIGLQITSLLVTARQEAPAPASPPPAPVVVAPAPEPPKTGLVLVVGGQAYLDRVGTRLAIGTVPVGRYTLFVLLDGSKEFIDEGTVEVHADERLVFRCTADGCVAEGGS